MRRRLLAVLCTLALVGSSLSLWAMPQAKAAAVGTTYYFSSIRGSNKNTGTSQSQAWETLDKLEGVKLKAGDRVLLERGSSFKGYIHLKDVHGTKDKPIVISDYGSGAKPAIHCGGEGVWYQNYNTNLDSNNHRRKGYVSSTLLLYDVDFVEVSNLELTNQSDDLDYFGGGTPGLSSNVDRMDRTGVAGIAQNGGTMEHVYLSNLYVHDVDGNIQDKHMDNGGIQMNASQPDDEEATGPARYEDVKIEGCYVENVRRAGIVVGYTYNWARFNQTGANREISDEAVKTYGHGNILLKGNYVKDIGNDGIVVMYSDRPLVENNVADHTGVDLAGDRYFGFVSAAIWPWKCKNAVFQYNEAFDTVNSDDGQAWDVDSSDGTVYQYNYSHNNGGGAVMFCLSDAYRGVFRYNISQNDLKSFFTLSGNPNAKIYNNVFYVDGDLTTKVHNPSFNTGVAYIANNIFYNATNNPQSGGWNPRNNKTFTNNLYYGYADTDLPADSNKVVADPKFIDPGKAPNKATTTIHNKNVFEGYKIADTSPAINRGIAIEGGAAKDFFGNKIGLVPDIGIHETNTPDPVSLEVQSDVYAVNATAATISNIPRNTKVKDFLTRLTYAKDAEVKVFDGSSEIGNEQNVGDVTTLRVTNPNNRAETKDYALYLARSEYAVTGMTATAGSAETGQTNPGDNGPASNVLDNDLNTMWHAAWGETNQDNIWIMIDMGSVQPVAGLKYTPRQSAGEPNGMFMKYKVQVKSDSSDSWQTVIEEGDWGRTQKDPTDAQKADKFANFRTVNARYVRLVGVETYTDPNNTANGRHYGSAAEIRVLHEAE